MLAAERQPANELARRKANEAARKLQANAAEAARITTVIAAAAKPHPSTRLAQQQATAEHQATAEQMQDVAAAPLVAPPLVRKYSSEFDNGNGNDAAAADPNSVVGAPKRFRQGEQGGRGGKRSTRRNNMRLTRNRRIQKRNKRNTRKNKKNKKSKHTRRRHK